jgi:hypothetical protein
VQDRDDSILDLEPLRQRAEGVRDWLTEKGRGCFEEQKHTRADTQEKIYWHYGYLSALTDVLNFLSRELTNQTTADTEQSWASDRTDRYN